MSLLKYMILPAGIAAVGVIYWFVSYESIGTVLLIIFAAAMAVMGWILVPTIDNVGPTAPVDPESEDPGR
jgi:energy-converting hydrogenase Eha subunit E